jgi:hypothetical protein
MDGSYHKEPPLSLLCKCKRKDSSAFQSYLVFLNLLLSLLQVSSLITVFLQTVQSTRGPGLSVSKPPPLRVEMELSPTFCTTPRLPTGPCLPRVPGLTQSSPSYILHLLIPKVPGVAHTTITEDWIRSPVSPAFYIQQVPSSQYICPSLPSEVMGNKPLPSPSLVQQLSPPQPFRDAGEGTNPRLIDK